ncbi:Maf-like protein [soil metagenome]
MNINEKKIILGSGSPRRKQLLEELFSEVDVRIKNVNEDFPESLQAEKIPLFLAEQKAYAFKGELKSNEILITADTIVWFDNHVLNKPADHDEALRMLNKLSGNVHVVYTGVCIATTEKRKLFSVASSVKFIKAGEKELLEYIDQYKPYDKAGSYGAQECLPEKMNPLSMQEKDFLKKIGKPDLFEKSLAVKNHARVHLIENIEGSYFNVMGLPVVELWDLLSGEF